MLICMCIYYDKSQVSKKKRELLLKTKEINSLIAFIVSCKTTDGLPHTHWERTKNSKTVKGRSRWLGKERGWRKGKEGNKMVTEAGRDMRQRKSRWYREKEVYRKMKKTHGEWIAVRKRGDRKGALLSSICSYGCVVCVIQRECSTLYSTTPQTNVCVYIF